MKVYAITFQEVAKILPKYEMPPGTNAAKRRRVENFIRFEDRQRARTGEWLLRTALSTELQLEPDSLRFQTNEFGKPLLENDRGCHFNISHSGNWVVCVIDDAPVGIDVERIQEIDLAVSRTCFTKAERADLFDKSEDQQLDYFFDLWTLKESYIKAIGEGMSCDLHSFSMAVDSAGAIHFHSEHDSGPWYFRQYPLGSGYRLAVCASHERFPAGLRRMPDIWTTGGSGGKQIQK